MLQKFVAIEGGMERIAWLVLKKVFSLALTVFMIASLVFSIFYVQAGDPVHRMIPSSASPEMVDRIVEDLHLDEALPVQFFYHILDAFTFDLPMSATVYRFDDIDDRIWEPIGLTVLLFAPIFLISLLVGWMVERFVYSRKRGRSKFVVHAIALLLLSVPIAGFYLLALKVRSDLNVDRPRETAPPSETDPLTG